MPVEKWGLREVDLAWLRAGDWWAKVDIRDQSDCWLWGGSAGSHGYGQTSGAPRAGGYLAHRVAWALHHDRQVPVGMTIDHVCRVKLCCNPAHLRLLSNKENATLNGQGAKTHCPLGHEYTEENTRTNAKGWRWCKECQVISNRKRYEPFVRPAQIGEF